MDINYNEIIKSNYEQVEEYIKKYNFSDKQKIEILTFYNRNRKDNVHVNMRKEYTQSIEPGVRYVHAFTENLTKLGQIMPMSGGEFLIMMKLCHLMQHGNILVNICQSTLAKELGMSKSNVCKCWKKLISKNVLIKKEGHTLINSNLFLKGQFHTINQERKEYVKMAQKTDSNGQNDIFKNVYKEKKTQSYTSTFNAPENTDNCDSVGSLGVFFDDEVFGYPESPSCNSTK